MRIITDVSFVARTKQNVSVRWNKVYNPTAQSENRYPFYVVVQGWWDYKPRRGEGEVVVVVLAVFVIVGQ